MSFGRLPPSSKPATVFSAESNRMSTSPAESFETYRSYLFSIAYRMLGSAMDAEDMVQETYLRSRSGVPDEVRSLKAFLTTVVTRLCIDQLQRAYRQRESYLGPWLPEPLRTSSGAPQGEEDAIMRESLSLAFLTVLERLQPVERAVFLLRNVFDYDYPDIAAFVGRKEAACRQIYSRAKRRLAADQNRSPAPPEQHRQLLQAYLHAVRDGDGTRLMDILADDVTLVADGGGKVAGAALHPITGRSDVSRFSLSTRGRFLPLLAGSEMAEVNHQPAIIIRDGGKAILVMTLDIDAGLVRTVRFMANPDKLSRL